jgi:hypothetical protein
MHSAVEDEGLASKRLLPSQRGRTALLGGLAIDEVTAEGKVIVDVGRFEPGRFDISPIINLKFGRAFPRRSENRLAHKAFDFAGNESDSGDRRESRMIAPRTCPTDVIGRG